MSDQDIKIAQAQPNGFGTVKGKKWKVTMGGSFPAGVPVDGASKKPAAAPAGDQ